MTIAILLVHGSFHTGECWEKLIPQLGLRGHSASAVTLSGHRGNPKWPWLVSMETYGSDVIAAAEALGRKCILVGHSMGGMVISEAVERRPDLFESMIYISAFVPRFGKCSLLKLEPVSPALRQGTKLSILNGTAMISPDIARQVFCNQCDPAVRERAVALLCPQPMRASMGAVMSSETGLGSVRKHYIECLDDEALPLKSQRAMQLHMSFESVVSINSDHSPFLCKPAALAELIAQIAVA